MANVEAEPDLPEEVTDALESFHEALGKVDDTFKPLLETSIEDIKEKLEPLECAKLDLVLAYAINSMFWMYLITQGINPKEHPVRQELDRIKKYMGKVKEATEKKQASMRIDQGAAKRFVKSALWQPNKEDNTEVKDQTNEEENSTVEETTSKGEKRKSVEKLSKTTPEKKKKRKK
ncbi:nuclear nucleic acid-binding protein C1D-like isoform X2 [Actinia tenebrosa]|uniref:Nuclear nucleic acid-binding protein C1D n=1 Tax=Actinia tenebrosa TaxID=6105 RepID=A0A6P8HQY4_ACTTE|nr:nuclear nucleic acid-binding protein C1D-like isoform X2 [Actinia tenebrosa]